MNALIRKLALLLTLLLAALGTSWAQVTGGTLLGTVTDPSNAVVRKATVAVEEQSTGVTRSTVTNDAGFYSIPNLQPGSYTVQVEANGFTKTVRANVPLLVGSQQTVDLKLSLGSSQQTVDVSATTSALETTSSTLGGEVVGESIRELPLNGRDWTQLATLHPGVNAIRNQANVGSNGSSDATKATRGFGTQLSVAGTRSSQNNYRLDGISFNDYTNDAPGGVLGTQTGVDAIREFSVLTTNYSAEYGRTSGGVINAVTRSGTNDWHGDVYEFLRNSALDARNYFDGPDKPPFKRNQFGASIGGPIAKDNTFFFFNYEGVRQALTATQVSTVPSQNARDGLLASGAITVDPQAARYLTFYPLPNGALLGNGDTGLYSVATLQDGRQNFYTARVDHKFSDKDTLYGTFVFDQTRLTQPDQLNNEKFLNRNSRPFVALEETHIFSPAFVNTVRFGFNRYGVTTTTYDPINSAAGDLSYGVVPGRPAPIIRIPGVSTFFGGPGGFPNFVFGWNSFQFYDDAFITRGVHSIKVGFALERMQSNNLFHFSDNGSFSFASLQAFLTNQPRSFGGSVVQPATPRGIRETLLAGYIQDDWRIRPSLTLNLGLRYETTGVPSEVNGKLATLRNMTDTVAHVGDPYFSNPTRLNFEPRIGFAWDPTHAGRFVIRGGAGIYDVLPLPYEFLILSSASAPFSKTITVRGLPAGSFPNQAYDLALAQADPNTLQGQRVVYVDPNPKRSYVTQWNLNVEKQLGQHVMSTIAYAGSRGVHLPYRTDDADIVLPTKTASGWVWPTDGSGTRLNPNVGRIDRLATDADSYYHALQLGTRVAPVHGLQLQASYTWSKSIDTGSSTIGGDQYTNSPSSLPLWFAPETRRAVSDFNLPHNFVLSGLWTLPNSHLWEGRGNWLSDGWQIGTILQASSGAPFSVLIGGDPLGWQSSDPYQFPDRVAGGGCDSLVNPGSSAHYIKTECFAVPAAGHLGNAGRNALVGPGLFNTDLSFYKTHKITERLNVQFRAEIFNIFNRANFAPPLENNVVFNEDGSSVGSAGVLTATQTTSRQVQFGLKVTF